MLLEKKRPLKKPRIAIREKDLPALSRLAEVAARSMPDVAGYLEDELARARIVSGRAASARVVGMGSKVEYRDDTTGQVRMVALAYPDEADLEAGKISVLSPVGAALIGLSAGQSIEWQTPVGGWRSLTILRADGIAVCPPAGAVANPANP